jgi:hypothetical protein
MGSGASAARQSKLKKDETAPAVVDDEDEEDRVSESVYIHTYIHIYIHSYTEILH